MLPRAVTRVGLLATFDSPTTISSGSNTQVFKLLEPPYQVVMTMNSDSTTFLLTNNAPNTF